MTQQERQVRWAKCQEYLRTNATLYGARLAAHEDGISFPTSVWLSALSQSLQRGETPPGFGGHDD